MFHTPILQLKAHQLNELVKWSSRNPWYMFFLLASWLKSSLTYCLLETCARCFLGALYCYNYEYYKCTTTSSGTAFAFAANNNVHIILMLIKVLVFQIRLLFPRGFCASYINLLLVLYGVVLNEVVSDCVHFYYFRIIMSCALTS